MNTLICDLDGVVYLGDEEIPGSGDALRRFSDCGWNLVFCTNNSSRTPDETAAKIARVTGFQASPSNVVTSAMAAATLIDPTSVVLVLGGEGLVRAIGERGCSLTQDWREARVVVVGLDPGLTYERLSSAVLAIGNGARFVASNHDRTYPTPEGLRPGAGSIAAAVSHATGIAPEVAGKPHPAMRSLLASRAMGTVWIVGDRDDTDLEMGRQEGWSTALVATGVDTDPEDQPTVAVADLSGLAAHLLE